MDPFLLRSVFTWLGIGGLALSLIGGTGVWIFSKRTEALAPYRQPIRSASALLTVETENPENLGNVRFAGDGCSIDFRNADSTILVVYSLQTIGRPTQNNRYELASSLEDYPAIPSGDVLVRELRNADTALISIPAMPDSAHLISGSVVLTLNGSVRLRMDLESQMVPHGHISVSNLQTSLGVFPVGI
jgi:hypothetical protein